MRVALDAMGGDHGPRAVVPAAARALADFPDLSITLVGQSGVLEDAVRGYDILAGERCRIVAAPDVVAMHDKPSTALRMKRDSSMRRAIDLVRAGEADAAVSAGNTGALMAIARFVLKMQPGIDRPAICAAMPGSARHTHMLDLGANVDAEPEVLTQFAVMGTVLSAAMEGRAQPAIGLLNIGEEEIKGGDRLRRAAELIQEAGLNYAGFVEGNDIFKSKVDVIVCDGFSGNVALKASEGTAQMITGAMREEFMRSALTRAAGLVARPILKRLRVRFDPRHYNGASLLGLRGIVVKSHGSADEKAFANALHVAVAEIENNVPGRISALLERQLVTRHAI